MSSNKSRSSDCSVFRRFPFRRNTEFCIFTNTLNFVFSEFRHFSADPRNFVFLEFRRFSTETGNSVFPPTHVISSHTEFRIFGSSASFRRHTEFRVFGVSTFFRRDTEFRISAFRSLRNFDPHGRHLPFSASLLSWRWCILCVLLVRLGLG
jgi:hypothetical protein